LFYIENQQVKAELTDKDKKLRKNKDYLKKIERLEQMLQTANVERDLSASS
jgi:hypothetical protein